MIRRKLSTWLTWVIIDKGAVQQIGTPDEVRESPANSFVEEFLDLDSSVPA
jgi:ABC-type sugar transport system ATPase subunit